MTKPRKGPAPRRRQPQAANGKQNGHVGPLAAVEPDTGQDKGGRPRIEIDWPQFDALCAVQATLEEVAGFFDCSVDTIERAVTRDKGVGFAEYHAQKSRKGKVSLRRVQFQLALKGDRTLLIWLGKQYLAQSDRQEVTGKGGGPIQQQTIPADDAETAERALVLIRRAEMRKRGVG